MATDFSFLGAAAVTASLVVDESGMTKTNLGNSRGIGNQTDLQLLLWLRKRSQIVLTSGITAAAEDYKYPSSSELAILTNSNRTYSRLSSDLEKVLFLSDLSFGEAIRHLQVQGFTHIHTEFGETGFRALSKEQVSCFISSKSAVGIEHFLRRVNLDTEQLFELPDLQIARVVGRGRD